MLGVMATGSGGMLPDPVAAALWRLTRRVSRDPGLNAAGEVVVVAPDGQDTPGLGERGEQRDTGPLGCLAAPLPARRHWVIAHGFQRFHRRRAPASVAPEHQRPPPPASPTKSWLRVAKQPPWRYCRTPCPGCCRWMASNSRNEHGVGVMFACMFSGDSGVKRYWR